MQQKEAAKREQELSNTDISNGVYAKSDRQVGSKSKRDDNEGDEDIEWEEAAPTGRYHHYALLSIIFDWLLP